MIHSLMLISLLLMVTASSLGYFASESRLPYILLALASFLFLFAMVLYP